MGQNYDIGLSVLGIIAAFGFGLFMTFFIYEETMGKNGFVRSFAFSGNGDGKGGVEPTSVLVAAFEVKIDIAVDIGVFADHCGKGGAAVEPNVHDIGFFGEFVAAAFAGETIGKKVFGFFGKPNLSTAFVAEEFL